MKSIIAWFARNRVAANLLMGVILVSGLLVVPTLTMEVFPEINTGLISVTVPYPGAAPIEVEEAVCIRIEEEIQGIREIKEIRSTAAENVGVVTVELLDGADVSEVLDKVKARVDGIDTFPEETESPVVEEMVVRRQVINIALAAPTDEKTLRRLAETVRDEISTLPGITQVELSGVRPYEISIDISEGQLRRHGLTFDQVAEAVRRSSLDVPGGQVRSSSGEILLRTEGRAYDGEDFAKIEVISRRDGTRIRVRDVATVIDGFAETDDSARFDGMQAVLIQVFRVGDQSALGIAETVKNYVEEARRRFPQVEITTWQDDSKLLNSRLDTMFRNGRSGLILVLAVLALFLRFRLAFWVSLGIPVSFLGAIALMPMLDISINVVSLFAFITVLGIVVDDAIVVGENIYSHYQEGKSRLRAAVDGAAEISVPVIFAVLTTIAAFLPLTLVPGATGEIFSQIPYLVMAVLAFSLIESLLILPTHLSHLEHRTSARKRGLASHFRDRFDNGLNKFIEKVYGPFLDSALRWRYLTIAFALTTLLLTIGLWAGDWIEFIYLPDVEAENMVAFLTMPLGTPASATADALARLEKSAEELRKELREEGHDDLLRHRLTTIGSQPFKLDQQQGGGHVVSPTQSAGHLGEVNIELASAEEREISANRLAERWRRLTGPIPGAVELTFSASALSIGDPIDILLSGPNLNALRELAEELKSRLRRYPGVYAIADSFREGKREIELSIRPEAELLGLSQMALGRQVRQAFFGEEAQRIQRGREEVKVMVRYPLEARRSLGTLENMMIRTPAGVEVPFSQVARVEFGRGFSTIERVDGNRAIHVTAKVDEATANANRILANFEETHLPELLADYPGVAYTLEGQQQEQQETLRALGNGFILALLFIFALMAIPLRSYSQPLLIMTAIPFGLVGAVAGHLIMGQNLTVLSMFGLVALAGVVVNDSLVFVDYVNRSRRKDMTVAGAARAAGRARFRPILLTSLTTFFGLTPMLLERSLQAQFLIPMVISLAFGVLFTTVITLVLLPAFYLVLEDLRWLFSKQRRSAKAESIPGPA